MNDPQYVIVHCSDSPQGRNDDAREIHRWHCERGFHGIGYHFVVLEDGEVQPGRPWFWEGAHATSHNDRSIGICRIGKNDDVNSDQLESLITLIEGIRHQFNIPIENVLGHREVQPGKTCPGFDVELLRCRLRENAKKVR